jgi:hypothetical protein
MNENEARSMEIVKRGTWRYDGKVTGFVWIVRQSWDYYYEDGFDLESPDLDESGTAHYVLSGFSPKMEDHQSRSKTCLSLEEAMSTAKETLPEVEWFEDGIA